MKTVIALVVGLAVNVWASCPNGCVEHYGTCACDEPAYKAQPVDVSSKETPPKHPQAAWERGEVKADMPQNLIAQDIAQDAEIAEANSVGKKAAGLQ